MSDSYRIIIIYVKIHTNFIRIIMTCFPRRWNTDPDSTGTSIQTLLMALACKCFTS